MTRAVSRETPPVPDVAGTVFGARLPEVVTLAEWLAGAATQRGLLGPRETPRLWERHLLNCGLLARLVPTGAMVGDLGSGAGLPGLVLALARPDLRVTLVEPALRRATYLHEVVADLAVANVSVLRARGEELHGTHTFGIVTARAVAPLPRLLDWAMPLVQPGGALLAMKGATAEQEVRDARSALQRHRSSEVVLDVLGADVLDPPVRVVRVVAGGRPGADRGCPR